MRNIKNTLTDCFEEIKEKNPKIKNNLEIEIALPPSFPELLRTGMIAGWDKNWDGDFRKYVEISEGLADNFSDVPPPIITPARIRLYRTAYREWRDRHQNHPMYEWSEAETKMLEEKVRQALKIRPVKNAARSIAAVIK